MVQQKYPNNTVGDVTGILGSIAAIFHHIAPIPIIISMFKKEIKVDKVPGSAMLSAAIVSLLFSIIGYQEYNPTIYISNSIGFITNAFYYFIFLYFYFQNKYENSENKTRQIVFAFGSFILVSMLYTTAIVVLYFVVDDSDISGWVGLCVSVLLFIDPFMAILKIIKNCDHKKISNVFTYAGLFSTTNWFIYALIGTTFPDFYFYIPNGLGVIFNLMQIAAKDFYERNSQENKQKDALLPKQHIEADFEKAAF